MVMKNKNDEKNGRVIGKSCPTFELVSLSGSLVKSKELISKGNLMLVFYPGGPIKPVCTTQLCDYRDNFDQFKEFNINIVAISNDSTENQIKFATKFNYPFQFLTDPRNKVAKLFKVNSFFVMRRNMRAIFIINQKGIVLYEYAEPTFLTRRGSNELIDVLKDLKNLKVI